MNLTLKDIVLSDINASLYDGIIMIGGSGAAVYLDNQATQDIIKTFYQQNKLVAAICMAPAILAQAGILENKKATVHELYKDMAAQYQLQLINEDVVADGNIITANGPAAAEKFARQIVDYFISKRIIANSEQL